jgi:uncharacterized protein
MSGYSVIKQLKDLRDEIHRQGVRRLTLFGPEARGEGRPGSEVHLLVELDPPLTFDHYLALRDFLAEALGRPVELVIESVEHPRIWEYVQEDAVEIVGS